MYRCVKICFTSAVLSDCIDYNKDRTLYLPLTPAARKDPPTTDGMLWIQISLDHTLRRLVAQWTRFSVLACSDGILIVITTDDNTDPVIQTRRDYTGRVRVSGCFCTIALNWNDVVAVGWPCCSIWARKAPAFLHDLSFAKSSSSSRNKAAGTRRSSKSCEGKKGKLHGHCFLLCCWLDQEEL